MYGLYCGVHPLPLNTASTFIGHLVWRWLKYISADILPKLCNQLSQCFMLWFPSHLPDIPQLCFLLHHLHLTQWPMEDYLWLECINWYLATSCIISPICMFRHHDIYWVSLIQPQFSHNILFYFIFLHQIWTEQVLMQCCPLLKPLFVWIKPLQNHSLSTTRARRQMW